jgi:hypothetical protein
MIEFVTKFLKVLFFLLLIVVLLWLVGGLVLGLAGKFPNNWQRAFLLRKSPLYSFGSLVLIGTAYWLKRRELLVYFGWAVLAPIMILGVAVFARIVQGEDFWNATSKSFGWPYPWRELFVLGILSALLVQLAVNIYFTRKGYVSSATFGNVISIMVIFMPWVLGSCVTLALIAIEKYKAHIWISVIYLAMVCFWDFCIWRLSKPETHSRYRTRCRELLVHVDGVVFGIVLFWVLLLPYIIRDDHVTFAFFSDIQTSQANSPNKPVDTEKLIKHKLEEPLMAGVIGFATILSMVLLVVHFGEWEKEERSCQIASEPDISAPLVAPTEG